MLLTDMRLLGIINPEGVNKADIKGWKRRRASRAVVLDNKNKVGILYVSKENYYKLPGGGIKKGESIRSALGRECEEELGVNIKIVKEIGYIVELRDEFKLYQKSYCYLARVISYKKGPRFTKIEKQQKFKNLWISINEAIELFNTNQITNYEGNFIRERDRVFLGHALKLIKQV